MDDLISRQDAIDTAINLFDSAKAVMIRICKALPSAQPEIEERKEESAQNVSKEDLISKKAAIDALDRFSLGETDAVKLSFRMGDYLRRLPSAQTERKNGEWEEIEVIADAYDISGVKTWASKMKCDQCGFTTIAIEGHFAQYNFCPNCGAKMEVEHETD